MPLFARPETTNSREGSANGCSHLTAKGEKGLAQNADNKKAKKSVGDKKLKEPWDRG